MAGGLCGMVGITVLVGALVAGGSAPEARTPAGPARPAAARAAPPPPDPLAPRAIRSTGTLTPVRGETPITSTEPATLFSIEIERGVEIDRRAFGRAVERTLLDRRSWAGAEGVALRRVAAPETASIRVVLASPRTTDELCLPLETRGTYSCHQNGRVVLNAERWARGAEAYGRDLTRYRQYMVNHEVGHALGHGHESCPGAGALAPVMVQQTKGVGECRPNPWPRRGEERSAGETGDAP